METQDQADVNNKKKEHGGGVLCDQQTRMAIWREREGVGAALKKPVLLSSCRRTKYAASPIRQSPILNMNHKHNTQPPSPTLTSHGPLYKINGLNQLLKHTTCTLLRIPSSFLSFTLFVLKVPFQHWVCFFLLFFFFLSNAPLSPSLPLLLD